MKAPSWLTFVLGLVFGFGGAGMLWFIAGDQAPEVLALLWVAGWAVFVTWCLRELRARRPR